MLLPVWTALYISMKPVSKLRYGEESEMQQKVDEVPF